MAGASDRTSLASQFNQILSQMDSLAGDSGYRGTNLLKNDDLTVNFNENGSSNLTINGVDATSLGLRIQRAAYIAGAPIAAGGGGWPHGFAITLEGQVVTFGGDNSYGENYIPAAAGSGVTSVSAGFDFALALKSDGSVIAWGNNTSGQTNAPLAAQSGVTAIAAGGSHSLALKSDGSIAVWGDFFGAYSGDVWTTSFPSTNSWATDAGISKSEQQLENALSTLQTDTQTLSSNLSVIGIRKEFTDSMVANLQTGADNLTLADMNEEGANMLMLQTRQSLGINSLSMAGQSAQSVMKLF